MLTFLLLFLVFLFPIRVQAIFDPTSVPNNKYGIHIADFNDIPDVPALVNSTGGDWGYVTVVSTDADRNRNTWQEMFNTMRRKHLIPIVRIATYVEKGYWAIPNPVDFDKVVSFFNSLNWPTENRYIVLYNEPNHAKEWGNTINPEQYAKYMVEFGKKFKQASADFFILPAGLDVSAATDMLSMDAALYLRRMTAAAPDFFDVIDGWTSHSYPNPGFSGSPYAFGRGTLTSFIWELSYLQQLGFSKQLPVFITETGWTHNGGKTPLNNPLTPVQVGNNLLAAASTAWNDSRVVAVTPFIFNYQDYPFDNFSWKVLGGSGYYAHYYSYQSFIKTKGTPLQHEAYVLSDPILPLSLVANSFYSLQTTIKNVGQGILSPYEYSLRIDDGSYKFTYDTLPTIEPDEKGILTIHITTPEQPKSGRIRLSLIHNAQTVLLQETDMTLVPPPSVTILAPLGWRKTSNAKGVKVLIYDKDTLIQKTDDLTLTNGTVTVTGVANIVPDRLYRIVIIVPYYLPRQQIVALRKENTVIPMKRLIPLDINSDGTFSFSDIITLLKNPPNDYLHLFIGP